MNQRTLLRGVCPGCRHRVKGESRVANKVIKCPACGGPVQMTAAEAAPAVVEGIPVEEEPEPLQFVRVVVPLNRFFGNRPLVFPKRCVGCWSKDVTFEVKLDYGTGNRTGHDGMGAVERIVVPLHACTRCFGRFEDAHIESLAEVRVANDSARVENAFLRREFKDGRCHLGFTNERFADAVIDGNPNVAFPSLTACKAAERKEALIVYPLIVVLSIMGALLITGLFFGVLEKALNF